MAYPQGLQRLDRLTNQFFVTRMTLYKASQSNVLDLSNTSLTEHLILDVHGYSESSSSRRDW
jgi:hypothetical protein